MQVRLQHSMHTQGVLRVTLSNALAILSTMVQVSPTWRVHGCWTLVAHQAA